MSNKLSEQIQEYARKHSKAPTWALDEWAEQARELENRAASSDREMVMALDQLRDAKAERDALRRGIADALHRLVDCRSCNAGYVADDLRDLLKDGDE